ncbi:LLM class flavin-dependent oxidoreductase [Actinomadura decatromicini]|uniref:LLM class flavin-dependent oxidoreductase n=3 Tax=Thermomonosporaceae TaxID=2012 RepID=A0A5D0U095_9ACTN|nr:LLM class flavin-dependent oxidoreductase [Actinomadura syzygii]TYK53559.1 LLM class flavin-dependent oxidoreductase [Actinomadura decatromicini]
MILTEEPWRTNAHRWRAAEELGFDSAWTYDHLHWRGLRGSPWYASLPVLAAAAALTERITIGVMVASPNFRHPVTLAKDVMTIDDISAGRFVLGIGAGSPDAGDAAALGTPPLPTGERAARFAEFVELTDRLLRTPLTTHRGRFYTVQDAVMIPGCVRDPRAPLAIAASGPRGLALAARYADAWVTMGPTDWSRTHEPAGCLAAATEQMARFRTACARAGRDPGDLDRIFVSTGWAGDPLASPKACLEMAERYAAAGFTDLIVHWPRPSGVYAGDPAMLDRIAEEVLPQIHRL